MATLRKIKTALIVTVVCTLVLWAYGVLERPLKTRTQDAFESWLAAVEQNFINSKESELPPIEVTISSPADKLLHWHAASNGQLTNRGHVLRILSQIREARLFSQEAAAHPGEPSLTIDIKSTSGDVHFTTEVAQSVFEKDVRAALLLKLFDLYQDEEQAKPKPSAAPAAQPPAMP